MRSLSLAKQNRSPMFAVRPAATVLLVGLLVGAACLISTRGQNVPVPPGAIALDSPVVSESSGLARSRNRNNLLWTHNDSGDWAQLFAFTTNGHLEGVLSVEGAAAVDWEDMCTFTLDGVNYIAVADVGDNRQSRRSVTIYVLKEPDVSAAGPSAPSQAARLTARVEHEIRVKYPDGPVNCEALAFDPWRQDFLLATKEPLRSRLVSVGFDRSRAFQEVTGKVLTTVLLPMVTGAAISDDGRHLALATYGPTGLVGRDRRIDWDQASEAQRQAASWNAAGEDSLGLIPGPPRRQGEAVCFDASGAKLLMTSEGTPMLLFQCDAVPEKAAAE